MSAGSSRDTGKKFKTFMIHLTEPPVIEIDTEATAVYVRLRSTQVVRTEPYGSERGLVMIDFDAAGDAVGVEVIGQQEFSIRELIKQFPVEASEAVLSRTRYVAADLQTT